jgi:hypothetical protein
MSILFGIWLASLITIMGIVLYGRTLHNRSFQTHEHPSIHLHDLIAHEVSELNKVFLSLLETAKPHGVRTARAGLVMIKRGQELIIHRVYGRMKVEKGRTSSFFLKHISEHKEQTKSERE